MTQSGWPSTLLVSRWTVFLVSLVVFLLLAEQFFDHTVDDAFISFRYARNLIEGHGLVFNPGERVEGYTNFLWLMLVVPALALGVDPVVMTTALGTLASVGLLAVVVRMSPRPDANPEVVWLAPLLTAVSPPLLVWASGGLEAPLFALLITAALGLAVRASEDEGRGLSLASALLLGLATLTRPEGFGVSLVILVCLVALRRWQPREIAIWCGWFAALFLPWFVWRLIYYSALLPNTFYAKVGATGAQVQRGVDYVLSYFDAGGYWLLLPIFGLLFCGRRRALLLIGSVTLALLGYVVLIGGDGLAMHRFVVPALPGLFLLLGLGAAGLAERFATRGWSRTVVVLLGLALCVRSAVPLVSGDGALYVEQDRSEGAAWKAMGLHLREVAEPGASVAVLTAGAIPWYSRLTAIDLLGLTDSTIARSPVESLGSGQAGHERVAVDYVLDRAPTYVLIGAYALYPEGTPPATMIDPYYPAELGLIESERFGREYGLAQGRTADGVFAYFVRR